MGPSADRPGGEDVLSQLRGGLIPIFRLRGHGFQNDVERFSAEERVELFDVDSAAAPNLFEHFLFAPGPERQAAGEHDEHDRPERVDVGSRIRRPAGVQLLGRRHLEVEHTLARPQLALQAGLGHARGESDVRQLRDAVLGDEYVVEADSPVNYVVLVRVLESGGDLLRDIERLLGFERLAAVALSEQLLEAFSLNVFEGDVVEPLVRSSIINLDDILMLK